MPEELDPVAPATPEAVAEPAPAPEAAPEPAADEPASVVEWWERFV